MLARLATATGGLRRRLKFWLLAFQGALAQRPAAEVVERLLQASWRVVAIIC
jgi:hypothetical protein